MSPAGQDRLFLKSFPRLENVSGELSWPVVHRGQTPARGKSVQTEGERHGSRCCHSPGTLGRSCGIRTENTPSVPVSQTVSLVQMFPGSVGLVDGSSACSWHLKHRLSPESCNTEVQDVYQPLGPIMETRVPFSSPCLTADLLGLSCQ